MSDALMSLEDYAALSAQLLGLNDPETIRARVAERGVDPREYERARDHYNAALAQDADAIERFSEHYRAALLAEHADAQTPSMEAYVESTALAYTGLGVEEIAARFDLSLGAYMAMGYRWLDRMAADPRLDTEVKLRIQRRVAQHTGEAPKVATRWVPGTMVRKRSCFRCGGLKVTPPRTAYIYCDFCGALFDMDPTVAAQDPSALDPDLVEEALTVAIDADLLDAFERGDADAYRALVRWKTEVSMDVAPQLHSPRIGDPTYRARAVEAHAEWARATRWDDDFVAEYSRLQRKMTETYEALGLDAILSLLEASRACWRSELALLEREGVLASDPDGIDEAMFMHVQGAQFCRRWLPFLGDSGDATRLIEAAGIGAQYVEAPMPDLERLTCGECAQRVEAPPDAHRKMCEVCGYVLALDERRVPCVTCGAAVALAATETTRTEYDCAYCGSHWAL